MSMHNIAGCEVDQNGREVFGVVSFIRPPRRKSYSFALPFILGAAAVVAVILAVGLQP